MNVIKIFAIVQLLTEAHPL